MLAGSILLQRQTSYEGYVDDQLKAEIQKQLMALTKAPRRGSKAESPMEYLEKCCSNLVDLIRAALSSIDAKCINIEDFTRALLEEVAFKSEAVTVQQAGDLLGLTPDNIDIRQIFDNYKNKNRSDTPAQYVRFNRQIRKIIAAHRDGLDNSLTWNAQYESDWMNDFVNELCTYLDDKDGRLINFVRNYRYSSVNDVDAGAKLIGAVEHQRPNRNTELSISRKNYAHSAEIETQFNTLVSKGGEKPDIGQHPTFCFDSAYVKREKYHREFDSAYRQGRRRIAFIGEPGNGKTRVALEILGEKVSSWSDVAVIRIDALRADLQTELGVRGLADNSPSLDELKYAFGQLLASESAPLFVVIDNLNNARLYNELVPFRARSTVIITVPSTAYEALPSDVKAHSIETGPLEPDEAVEFVKNLLPEASDKEVAKIAQITGGRTLVIEHVVRGLLTDSILSVEEVCTELRRRTMATLALAPFSAADALPWAYERIALSLAQRSPMSGELMNLISMMAPANIPVELLLETMKDKHGRDYQRLSLQVQLRVLRHKRLIQITQNGISVHQLTQALWREHCTSEEKQLCLRLHYTIRRLHADEHGNYGGEGFPLAWTPHVFQVLTALGAVSPTELLDHSIYSTLGGIIRAAYRFGGFDSLEQYLVAFAMLHTKIDVTHLLESEDKPQKQALLRHVTGVYELLRALFLNAEGTPIEFLEWVPMIESLSKDTGDEKRALSYVTDMFEILIQERRWPTLMRISEQWFTSSAYSAAYMPERVALINYVKGQLLLAEGNYHDGYELLTKALRSYSRYLPESADITTTVTKYRTYIRILYSIATCCWRGTAKMAEVQRITSILFERIEKSEGDITSYWHLRLITIRMATHYISGGLVAMARFDENERLRLFRTYSAMLEPVRNHTKQAAREIKITGHGRLLPRILVDSLLMEPVCKIDDGIFPEDLCIDEDASRLLTDRIVSTYNTACLYQDWESAARLLIFGLRRTVWRGKQTAIPISEPAAREAFDVASILQDPYLYAESLATAVIYALQHGLRHEHWLKEVEDAYKMIGRQDRWVSLVNVLDSISDNGMREALYCFLFSS